jgi:hypothetical protein
LLAFASFADFFLLSNLILFGFFRTMAPLHGEKDERVNIRINDATMANNIHKAAVTRDYIKQPRLSKKNKNSYLS